AAVMSLVKYSPQSVPANTCWANLGLAMIESTGMSGRLPVLLLQTNVAQLAVQVTWKTWPGVVGVLALKPPTAASPLGPVVVVGGARDCLPDSGRPNNQVAASAGRTGRAADVLVNLIWQNK